MERYIYGSYWKITRHNEHERYKVKYLKENGKWDLMITHDNLDFIKAWLCAEGVIKQEELNENQLVYLK